MITIAEIADRDGSSRPTVSRIVKRLVEQFGLVVERDGRGRVTRVHAAQYDRLRDRSDGPPPSTEPGAGPEPTSPGKAYAAARARKMEAEAARCEMELAELQGRMVPQDAVGAAIREGFVLMNVTFDLALVETAEDLARLSGVDAGLLRIRLRKMKEQMIAGYQRGCKRLLEACPPDEVTWVRTDAEILEIAGVVQPSDAGGAPHPGDV